MRLHYDEKLICFGKGQVRSRKFRLCQLLYDIGTSTVGVLSVFESKVRISNMDDYIK